MVASAILATAMMAVFMVLHLTEMVAVPWKLIVFILGSIATGSILVIIVGILVLLGFGCFVSASGFLILGRLGVISATGLVTGRLVRIGLGFGIGLVAGLVLILGGLGRVWLLLALRLLIGLGLGLVLSVVDTSHRKKAPVGSGLVPGRCSGSLGIRFFGLRLRVGRILLTLLLRLFGNFRLGVLDDPFLGLLGLPRIGIVADMHRDCLRKFLLRGT